MIRESLSEARAHFGEVVDRARLAGKPTIITDRGKEAAVVIAPEQYARLRQLEEEATRRKVIATAEAWERGDLEPVELSRDELLRLAGLA